VNKVEFNSLNKLLLLDDFNTFPVFDVSNLDMHACYLAVWLIIR
jgi:hypothetical protein